MAITPVKMIRLGGASLDLATELVQDFKKKGYRSTYSSIVDTAVTILHAVTIGNYRLVSDEDVAKLTAYDIGTAIASTLGALCQAKVNMEGCQMGYHADPVDAISIRTHGMDNPILMSARGADPALIANIVKTQLFDRGYLNDDGTVVVDMEKMLGPSVKGT